MTARNVLVLIMLSACGVQTACGVQQWSFPAKIRPVVVGTDGATSIDQLWTDRVTESASNWNLMMWPRCAGVGQFLVDANDPSAYPVRLVPDAMWSDEDACGGDSVGCESADVIDIRGDVQTMFVNGPTWGLAALAHEMGHAHGGEHNDEPDSVLNVSLHRVYTPSTKDADRAAAAIGCTP